jgi:hypothetical protein
MSMRRQASEQLGSLASTAATDGLRLVADRANRSEVSFYTVDPQGVMTDAVQPQHRGSSRVSGTAGVVKLPGMDRAATRDYLRTMADDTGGRASFDTNDLGRGLQHAWEDAKGYYLVGYEPTIKRSKGRFRRVSVKINRAGTDIRYRHGYYELSAKEQAEQDIDYAFLVPEPFDRPGFEAEVAVEGQGIKIAVRVPPGYLHFVTVGSEHRADFSVHGELRDSRGALVGGKPLAGRDVALRLDTERFAAIRSANTLTVMLDGPLPPPGAYRLAVVARDESGWMAVRRIDLVIRP